MIDLRSGGNESLLIIGIHMVKMKNDKMMMQMRNRVEVRLKEDGNDNEDDEEEEEGLLVFDAGE